MVNCNLGSVELPVSEAIVDLVLLATISFFCYFPYGPITEVSTVECQIVTIIICVKNFRVVKFSWFCSICEIFLVDYCNMDEHLGSSWCLVYYQVSGEPGIAHCSRRSDIYLVECGFVRKLIH